MVEDGVEVDDVVAELAEPLELLVEDPTGTVVGLSGRSLTLWYMRMRRVFWRPAAAGAQSSVSPIVR